MRVRAAAAAILLGVLYFHGLTATGVLGPDEPRYASIGREMARSGDWITPRLWGAPWFEKPALLYWMIAAGFRAGCGPDLAPRIGVALAGVAFLAFFYFTLRRAFGERAARFSTIILGTSPGWLAYSRVGVTDLPMTVAFAAAMLLTLEWVDQGDARLLPAAAALLGLAVLAKGLVPLVLAAPLVWMGRRRLADLLRPRVWGVFLAVAAPWYALCYWRNGAPFVHTFFWLHQVERFSSGALLHEQPFWFYAPVLAAGLAPWTPLALLLFRGTLYRDRRRAFLLLWVVWGFVFFSASTNKLPGYLLPLTPAVAALAGSALAEAKRPAALLAACAVLLVAVPVMAYMLPAALATGITHAGLPPFSWLWLIPVALAACVWRARSADAAMTMLGAAAAAGVLYVQITTLPAIDLRVSARPIWREIEAHRAEPCVGQIRRDWRYGLDYYAVTPLPDCVAGRPGQGASVAVPVR
jgi:4-amino-4-deoxy-L-arabinose transferase-like glycosyltransferase